MAEMECKKLSAPAVRILRLADDLESLINSAVRAQKELFPMGDGDPEDQWESVIDKLYEAHRATWETARAMHVQRDWKPRKRPMLFVMKDGQPVPVLPEDQDGTTRVPDGETLLTIHQASRASGMTLSALAAAWDSVWKYFP